MAGKKSSSFSSNGQKSVLNRHNYNPKSVDNNVKSSENVRSKSLAQFMDLYHPEYAIRISTKNFGFDNNIKSVPLYAVHCINE
jgi:hypothetical protein